MKISHSKSAVSGSRIRNGMLLLLHAGWITVVWIILLPMLAKWQPIHDHLRRMQESEVAVEAMFYTELDWHPGR